MKRRKRKRECGSFQGYAHNDLKSPIGAHVFKFPPSPHNAKLDTRHLGNIGDPNCGIKYLVKERRFSLLKDEVISECITALITII
jgi:hypothetical protein